MDFKSETLILSEILEGLVKYGKRRERSLKNSNPRKVEAWQKKVMDFLEESFVKIGEIKSRAFWKKHQEQIESAYLGLIYEASAYGHVELCQRIYSKIIALPLKNSAFARAHASQVMIEDLLCCSNFGEIKGYFQELKRSSLLSGNKEIFLVTGKDIIGAIRKVTPEDFDERFKNSELAVMVHKGLKEVYRADPDDDSERLFGEATYLLISALKNCERHDRALEILKHDTSFRHLAGLHYRYLSAYSLLSHFLGNRDPKGYRFLEKYFDNNREDMLEELAKGNAAVHYVRECIRSKEYAEAKIVYEFLTSFFIIRSWIFISHAFIIATELMNALLEDDVHEMAYEVFQNLPDQPVEGEMYESLFNAALLLIFYYGERNDMETARGITGHINFLAATRADALAFAEALLGEMSVCLKEELPRTMQTFYDSYVPYDDSPDIKDMRTRMTLLMISAFSEYRGLLDKAFSYYKSLDPLDDNANWDLKQSWNLSESKLCIGLLMSGEILEADSFLREHLVLGSDRVVTQRWLTLAKRIINRYLGESDFNSAEDLFLFLKSKLPPNDKVSCDGIFQIAKLIINALLKKERWKKAVSIFKSLPQGGKSPLCLKLHRRIFESTFKFLSHHNRASDLLGLFQAIPANFKNRRFSLYKAKAGLSIVEEIASKGHLEEAGKILEGLIPLQGGESVDLIRGKAAVHFMRACLKEDKSAKALELFKSFPKICDPSLMKKSLNSLARALTLAFSKDNDMEKLGELSAFMQEHHLRL
ncbi:MAG: hypothetical protein LBE27_08395 [Deltaproteobacteria bacterium]|jgi:hypothetical protein|nr:hypothetical protein [Deltaproteobacteria bacterium]